MKKIMLILVMICVLLVGCTETQQSPQYGTGDPPADYQEYFGNDNGARLDFMQNKAIGELAARIERLEDPNRVEVVAND